MKCIYGDYLCDIFPQISSASIITAFNVIVSDHLCNEPGWWWTTVGEIHDPTTWGQIHRIHDSCKLCPSVQKVRVLDIAQILFSSTVSCMKMFKFCIQFHWNMFLHVWLMVNWDWFQFLISDDRYLYLCCQMVSVGHNELTHGGLVTPYDAIDLKLTLVQVMACCLTASSHYLNQCWLFISIVLHQSPEGNSTGNAHEKNHCSTFENYT